MTDEISLEELIARLLRLRPDLDPLQAALLAAVQGDIASDSRSFARLFAVAHALVLRATGDLADDLGLLAVVSRDARTQRLSLALTAVGDALLEEALQLPSP